MPANGWTSVCFGGERGIRTPGPVTVNSFQDCRNRPLCQLSGAKVSVENLQAKKNRFFYFLQDTDMENEGNYYINNRLMLT